MIRTGPNVPCLEPYINMCMIDDKHARIMSRMYTIRSLLFPIKRGDPPPPSLRKSKTRTGLTSERLLVKPPSLSLKRRGEGPLFLLLGYPIKGGNPPPPSLRKSRSKQCNTCSQPGCRSRPTVFIKAWDVTQPTQVQDLGCP